MNVQRYMYGLKNYLSENLGRDFMFMISIHNTIEIYNQAYYRLFTIEPVYVEQDDNIILYLKRATIPFETLEVITVHHTLIA